MGMKSILVVDDHDSLRTLLGALLSKRYSVTCKHSALSAMAWMQSGNIPDLILLDINMPKISGIDFLEMIKSSGIYNNIKVVIISGDIDNEGDIDKKTKKICYELGISDFVSKPFNPVLLHEKLQKILNPLDQKVRA